MNGQIGIFTNKSTNFLELRSNESILIHNYKARLNKIEQHTYNKNYSPKVLILPLNMENLHS